MYAFSLPESSYEEKEKRRALLSSNEEENSGLVLDVFSQDREEEEEKKHHMRNGRQRRWLRAGKEKVTGLFFSLSLFLSLSNHAWKKKILVDQ